MGSTRLSITQLIIIILQVTTLIGMFFIYKEITKEPVKPIPQEPIKPVVDVNKLMVEDLTYTIFAEDRKSVIGMKHVMSVIMNRAKSNKLEDLHRVIKSPYQFSCWKNGKRVYQRMTDKDMHMYGLAKIIVSKAISGRFKPITNATHFYNPIKANPTWAISENFKQVASVNDHVYMKHIIIN